VTAPDQLSEQGAKKAEVLPEGAVLVSCIGILGKTGIAEKPVAFNQQINAAIFDEKVLPRYGFYYLQSAAARSYLHDVASATTVTIVNKSKFSKTPFPLPPLPEQRRIVAKIEELFSNLDAGMADLQAAGQQLERYRLSVLQAAVEGRLTADWRRTHDPEPADQLLERILEKRQEQWEEDYRAKYEAKGKEPPSGWKSRYTAPDDPDTDDLPDLPDGWIWTNIENVCIVYGGVTKNARKGGDLVEMPYLRVANVYANELRLDEIKQIKVKRNRLYKYFLEEGDLLVVEGNGSKSQIGRVARWDGSIDPCVHQNHLFKVRPMLQQMGHYLLRWMLSPNGRSYITQVASSTSGLYTLSMTKIRSLPVPLPPLAEQKQIVDEIERLLSVADDAAATADREHTRAERLRQSILKQAFSGRLVPHDEDAEPLAIEASSSNGSGQGSPGETSPSSDEDASDEDDVMAEELYNDGDPGKQIEMDL
jgi:type I restriction enzyme S subunit